MKNKIDKNDPNYRIFKKMGLIKSDGFTDPMAGLKKAAGLKSDDKFSDSYKLINVKKLKK